MISGSKNEGAIRRIPLVALAAWMIGSIMLSCSAVQARTLPKSLWVVERASWPIAEQTLAVTLQGLTANSETPIWLDEPNGMHGVVLQGLRDEGVLLRQASSVWDLLQACRESVDGYIVYESRTDSLNVATALCGIKNAVAVTPALVESAKAAGLSELLDVRGMTEMDAWERYGNLFSKKRIAVQDEKKSVHLRDWVVHEKAFCFYGLSESERAVILGSMEPNHWVLGWEGEREFVQAVSKGGGLVLPADWSLNLSVTSRLPATLPRKKERPLVPARKGERIVAFVMTDGDNVQFMGGAFVARKGFWASPHRGSFPMTWEMPPLLTELNPRALSHFYRTASQGPNEDGFVAGPSGAGYVFPHHHRDPEAFAAYTGRVMEQAQFRIATLLNADGNMEEARPWLDQPQILGAVYKGWLYDSEKGRILWHQGKPCVSYRFLLWEPHLNKSPQAVARAIAEMPADPTANEASYALINVHAWSFSDLGGPMEAVKQTIDRLPPQTRVVTAEEMIRLLRHHQPARTLGN